jgi:ankyrin repeat protein
MSEEVDKAGAYSKGREVLTKSIEAVQKGDLEEVKKWLGSDITEKLQEISEGKNRKLIHFAAIFGHVHIIDWIVANGGDAFVLDDDQNSISSLATYNERKEALFWIVEKFPELFHHKNAKRMNLLHIAAESCNFEIVQFLIEKGLDVNSVSENGTPLELAVMWKKIDMAKFLLEKGADPNGSCGKFFPPPLVMAASMNNRQVLSLLLQYGADVELTGVDKVSALEVACEFAFDFIDELIEKGAQLTGSHLIAALKNGKNEVLDKFLKIEKIDSLQGDLEKNEEAEEFKRQGNEEFSHKNFIEAAELYTKAIELSKNSFYYSNRSQAFNLMMKFELGLEDARTSRAIDCKNFKALLREGQALEGLERYLEAAGCYWNAYKIEKNPAIYKVLVDALNHIF